MRKIDIYTDGACSGNPGKGGCAFIILENGKEIENAAFGFRHTTNNRMEILAVIRALQNFFFEQKDKNSRRDTDIKVTVYSDSQLVVNTIKLGWAKKTNKDLWEELDDVLGMFTGDLFPTFVKVKGHAGNNWNERVDKLAVAAYQKNADMLDCDHRYENISNYNDEKPFGAGIKNEPTLFAVASPEETVIEDIVLKGHATPNDRSIEVHLSNGTVVKIVGCYGGFEQYNCTSKESAITVDIAIRFTAWLNGKKL